METKTIPKDVTSVCSTPMRFDINAVGSRLLTFVTAHLIRISCNINFKIVVDFVYIGSRKERRGFEGRSQG